VEVLLNKLALERPILNRKKRFGNLILGLICYSIASSQPPSRDTVPLNASFVDFKFTKALHSEMCRSKLESGDYPNEFRLTLSLNITCQVLKHQVRQHLLANARHGPLGERCVQCKLQTIHRHLII
jgi:hypothetical protein